jgi:hypothetical protein
LRSGCRRLDRGGSKPQQLNSRVDTATGFPSPREQIERRPRLFDPARGRRGPVGLARLEGVRGWPSCPPRPLRVVAYSLLLANGLAGDCELKLARSFGVGSHQFAFQCVALVARHLRHVQRVSLYRLI